MLISLKILRCFFSNCSKISKCFFSNCSEFSYCDLLTILVSQQFSSQLMGHSPVHQHFHTNANESILCPVQKNAWDTSVSYVFNSGKQEFPDNQHQRCYDSGFFWNRNQFQYSRKIDFCWNRNWNHRILKNAQSLIPRSIHWSSTNVFGAPITCQTEFSQCKNAV